MNMAKLHPEYITDEKGQKRAVILPIEEFDELLEDMGDLALVAERRDESTVPHSQVVEDLKRSASLPD